jgi:hypothetical protein
VEQGRFCFPILENHLAGKPVLLPLKEADRVDMDRSDAGFWIVLGGRQALKVTKSTIPVRVSVRSRLHITSPSWLGMGRYGGRSDSTLIGERVKTHLNQRSIEAMATAPAHLSIHKPRPTSLSTSNTTFQVPHGDPATDKSVRLALSERPFLSAIRSSPTVETA